MKESFHSLINEIRKKNPDLISEEAANTMLSEFDAKYDDLKSDAMAEGQALGFKEGYNEGKRVAADEAKKSMDDLIAQLDTESTEKLKAIVDMLNEQHAEKLQEIYDMLTSSMVPIKDVEAMDADHAEKFEEALGAQQAFYNDKMAEECVKLKKAHDLVMEEREKFHAKKTKAIKLALEEKLAKTEKLLVEEKNRKLDIMAENVERYLNYALQQSLPTRQLISEHKYRAAQKALEKITSIIKINHILQESKDGIFQDYENKLATAKENANKLLVENTKLKEQLEKQEAKVLLESKIKKCTPTEASFLRLYFKNATSKVIEEQIEDARSVFARLHKEDRRQKTTTVEKTSTKSPISVVQESAKKPVESVKKVVTESVKETEADQEADKKQNVNKSYDDIYREILGYNK